MSGYHSQFTTATQLVGNMAMLPLRTDFKGPAAKTTDDNDIIDETIGYFKANVFFKHYEIKSEADRTLIYITLYITECLKRVQKCVSKTAGQKELATLAMTRFDIVGEPGFPSTLSAMFARPRDAADEQRMREYFLQLRQETSVRIADRVFSESDKPSKWWMCFARRKFMDLSLSPMGA